MNKEFKGKYLNEKEYTKIIEYSTQHGISAIVKVYIENDEWQDMRKFATAEVEGINGINRYDFYASGEKPNLDEIEEIIHRCFPKTENYIFNQVKKFY